MTELTARPRRLSLSDIVEMLLTHRAERSTVSLTRTASGEVVIDVKVQADTVADASEQAVAELARLTAAYPRRDDAKLPSVSLSRNAKGDTQIDVKHEGLTETADAYDKARAAYPMANGLTAKPGTVA
jgi:hypothetical protein